MRFFNAFFALAVLAFAYTAFGSDGDPVTFAGGWRTASTDSSKNTTTHAEFVKNADGSVAINAEIRVDGKLRNFSTTGTLEGDSVHYSATLSREGFVDKLEGELSKPETIEGSYVLHADKGEIAGGWTLSSGASGDDDFFRRGTGWQEKYMGGSADAEAAMIKDLAKQVNQIQDNVAKGKTVERGFHNKGFGFDGKLTVASDIAPELVVGAFTPGASYPAIVRFSNAGADNTTDLKPDQKGLAVRVKTGSTKRLLTGLNSDQQDFLTTNSPVTARDPVQFLDFARALTLDPTQIPAVEKKYGLEETIKIGATMAKNTDLVKSSLTKEKIWSSRAPFKWGPFAVKFSFTPAETPKLPGIGLPSISKNRLENDMEERLHQGDLVLDMWVQRFDSEATTPIEDGSVEWKTPMEKVGQLTIPKLEDGPAQDAALAAIQAQIEKQAFNPWNTTEDFRPLGSINRARKTVYEASAGHRGGCPLGYVMSGK